MKYFIFVIFACLTATSAQAFPPGYLFEDITNHGAIPNDGIDDSAAILDAINAARTKSKRVLIPYGTFTLGSSITLTGTSYDNIQIEGLGWNSIIEHTGSGTAFRIGNGAQPYVNMMHFSNFAISATGNSNADAAIYFHGAHRSTVSRVKFSGYLQPNVGAQGEGAAAIKYTQSWIHLVKESIFLSCHTCIRTVYTGTGNAANALTIQNNDMEDVRAHGVYLDGVNTVNIDGNTIEGHNIEYGVYVKTGRGINITGNYLEGNSEPAIYLDRSAYIFGVNITGNRIFAPASDYYVMLKGGKGVVLTGNTFSSQPQVAYIELWPITFVRELTILSNSTEQASWDNVDYIRKPAEHAAQPVYYGLIYDNETDGNDKNRLIYGKMDKLIQDI